MTTTLYRDGALADGRSDRRQPGISLLIRDGVIARIRPSDEEGEIPGDARVIDASGSTIVPGMVDAHSHLTLPGGAHWIQRIGDPPERLVEVAEDNARLLTSAGVRWARDVGSRMAVDPVDGRHRAADDPDRDRDGECHQDDDHDGARAEASPCVTVRRGLRIVTGTGCHAPTL